VLLGLLDRLKKKDAAAQKYLPKLESRVEEDIDTFWGCRLTFPFLTSVNRNNVRPLERLASPAQHLRLKSFSFNFENSDSSRGKVSIDDIIQTLYGDLNHCATRIAKRTVPRGGCQRKLGNATFCTNRELLQRRGRKVSFESPKCRRVWLYPQVLSAESAHPQTKLT
jgi:hypothetical protein